MSGCITHVIDTDKMQCLRCEMLLRDIQATKYIEGHAVALASTQQTPPTATLCACCGRPVPPPPTALATGLGTVAYVCDPCAGVYEVDYLWC